MTEQVMVDTKPASKSKSVWLNSVAAVGALGAVEGAGIDIPEPWGIIVLAILNVLVRLFSTKGPITFFK